MRRRNTMYRTAIPQLLSLTNFDAVQAELNVSLKNVTQHIFSIFVMQSLILGYLDNFAHPLYLLTPFPFQAIIKPEVQVPLTPKKVKINCHKMIKATSRNKRYRTTIASSVFMIVKSWYRSGYFRNYSFHNNFLSLWHIRSKRPYYQAFWRYMLRLESPYL